MTYVTIVNCENYDCVSKFFFPFAKECENCNYKKVNQGSLFDVYANKINKVGFDVGKEKERVD